MFPNLYIFLIGPPGVGKSSAIKAVGKYLREIEKFSIGSTSVTPAALVDELVLARKQITCHPDPQLEYNSLLLMPDELGALIHKNDAQLTSLLNTLYDVDSPYSESRRGTGSKIYIPDPQLSILAGDTPSHLHEILPPGAWDQGFMSRVMMIFAGDKVIVDDIFASSRVEINEDLMHDILQIATLRGQFAVDEECRDMINAWNQKGLNPGPTHPKLQDYRSRRLAHFQKLMMVSAVDRGDQLRITCKDFERAKDWLLEAEALMPFVFSNRNTGDSRLMDEVLHYIGAGEKNETQVVRFLCHQVSSQSAGNMIRVMENTRMIKVVREGNQGRVFKVT